MKSFLLRKISNPKPCLGWACPRVSGSMECMILTEILLSCFEIFFSWRENEQSPVVYKLPGKRLITRKRRNETKKIFFTAKT
jgi:hypothetical protein